MNDAKVPLGQVIVTPAAQWAVEQAETCAGEILWVVTEDGTTTVFLPI